MRNLIIALMASAASIAAVSSAGAADAVDTIPQAPSAPIDMPASSDWSGAYIGATGSYNWGHINNAGRANAYGGGVYGGYNMQDGQLVYGAEANLDYSGAQRSSGGVRAKEGVNGAVRARVGVDASPFLIYGAGGVAASNLEVTDGTNTSNRTLWGWTAGVGAEAKVTDNVTARVEYDYTNFGKRDFNLGGTNVSRGYDQNSVKVGLGYKF